VLASRLGRPCTADSWLDASSDPLRLQRFLPRVSREAPVQSCCNKRGPSPCREHIAIHGSRSTGSGPGDKRTRPENKSGSSRGADQEVMWLGTFPER